MVLENIVFVGLTPAPSQPASLRKVCPAAQWYGGLCELAYNRLIQNLFYERIVSNGSFQFSLTSQTTVASGSLTLPPTFTVPSGVTSPVPGFTTFTRKEPDSPDRSNSTLPPV